jgi:hypothetical protein
VVAGGDRRPTIRAQKVRPMVHSSRNHGSIELTAFDDDELSEWLTDVIAEGSQDFLAALAELAISADPENYVVIRPALVELKRKHHASSARH